MKSKNLSKFDKQLKSQKWSPLHFLSKMIPLFVLAWIPALIDKIKANL